MVICKLYCADNFLTNKELKMGRGRKKAEKKMRQKKNQSKLKLRIKKRIQAAQKKK